MLAERLRQERWRQGTRLCLNHLGQLLARVLSYSNLRVSAPVNQAELVPKYLDPSLVGVANGAVSGAASNSKRAGVQRQFKMVLLRTFCKASRDILGLITTAIAGAGKPRAVHSKPGARCPM